MSTVPSTTAQPQLRRALGLSALIFYGIVLIQPTAPMPLFGVVDQKAQGHVVTAILFAMVAMLFTAVGYGRMARVYPSAGSAYTYVGRELHPVLGYLTGWALMLDYVLNPIICVIWCSKAIINFVPAVPYAVWAVLFALAFTFLNLRGIETSARVTQGLAIAMTAVVMIVFYCVIRYVMGLPSLPPGFYWQPFYDPKTFSWALVSNGTSIAVLTYIGFDAISTLSEEVRNPQRNVLLATVLVCAIIGVLSAAEVYAGQLVWPDYKSFPDADTAYVHVAGRAGGPWLFGLVNLTLLVANMGSGMGAQMAASRMLYGMGRDNELPRKFFGALDPKTNVPRNNILLSAALVLVGAFSLSYEAGAELLNFGAFVAFLGVNLSSLTHYYIRKANRTWSHLVIPVLGFLTCAYIWYHLAMPSKIAGFSWLVLGLIYRLVRQRQLRSAPAS